MLSGGLAVATPASAISGGHRVAQGAFPWMVRILPVQCGGTLISPELVLTAKHCVDDVAATGFTVTVAGWGASQWDSPQQRRLHRVDLPFLPDDDCAWTDGGYAGPYLCTSSVGRRSHCKGDSGGPGLHRLPDGRWEQVGIVSFGSDCDWAIGEEPQPVFTDVAYFAGDIKRAARRLLAHGR